MTCGILRGTPMYHLNYEMVVNVLIETKDGRTIYRDWHGRTATIRKAAVKKYAVEFPGAKLSFGRAYQGALNSTAM